MEKHKTKPSQENKDNISTQQETSTSSFVQEPKVKKKNFILIITLTILSLALLSLVAYYFIQQQDVDLSDDELSLQDFIKQEIKWGECERKRGELRNYVEDKNYCNSVEECQIVWVPQCYFGLAGETVDMEYIGEIYSEFYSPDGDCWTGEAPECPNPEDTKTMFCENNKCVLKPPKENGQQKTKSCEEYTLGDCPEWCYPYFHEPSSCDVQDDGFIICTDDVRDGCSSEPYDPFRN